MIEKNIGNIERLFRLIFGVIFGAWVALQPQLNGIEWFVLIVALMLILNSIFSRCYVWYILDINTCADNNKDCADKKTTCL